MTKNRTAAIEFCCWPGCSAARYHEPDAPPFCGNHMVRCAVYISASMKDLLDPAGETSPLLDIARPPRDSTGDVVYYVRLGDHIKIGTTRNLKARMSSLYVDHDPEALLGYEPGDRKIEHQRHAQFASERVYANRELFNPSRRLLAHIEGLKQHAA